MKWHKFDQKIISYVYVPTKYLVKYQNVGCHLIFHDDQGSCQKLHHCCMCALYLYTIRLEPFILFLCFHIMLYFF
jgi:hypothetical protein